MDSHRVQHDSDNPPPPRETYSGPLLSPPSALRSLLYHVSPACSAFVTYILTASDKTHRGLRITTASYLIYTFSCLSSPSRRKHLQAERHENNVGGCSPLNTPHRLRFLLNKRWSRSWTEQRGEREQEAEGKVIFFKGAVLPPAGLRV